MASREIRETLFEKQKGQSPLSGKPLTGRLEVHHIKEVYEGGNGDGDNLQLITLAEHLAEHYRRSRDGRRSEEDKMRELDTVLGRIPELTKEESRELSEVIFEWMGVRVRFI